MSNILVEVADAVTAALNDADEDEFEQKFIAVRSYADWTEQLSDQDSDELKVDVVPVGPLPVEAETRGSLVYSPEIDVLVRIRLGPERREADGRFSKEEIDQYVFFVQQINEFFTFDTLPPAARWDAEKGNRILAAYRRRDLREWHQFTGHIRTAWNVSKTLE